MRNRLWIGIVLVVAATADAGVILDFHEVGGDVVATGGGTLDLSDLTFETRVGGNNGFLNPQYASTTLGTSSFAMDSYSGISGPTDFGAGGARSANSSIGDKFGVIGGFGGRLFTPGGYVSGATLSATTTWARQTFSSLGLTVGTYEWTWGSGDTADSFTVRIGTAPEIAPVPLPPAGWMGLGMLALLGIRRRLVRRGQSED